MSKIKSIEWVIWICSLLFLLLLWGNEYFDIPHLLLGFPQTPFNFPEVVQESIIFLTLLTFCIYSIRKIEKRIKYLEGFAQLCCNCKRVKHNDQWIEIDKWLYMKSEVKISHGMCKSCLKELYPDCNQSECDDAK